ncbi:MAG: hypothetical protein GYA57_02365 [Myxococcales bacterium]|nr:hypothetical protein [Myxococcales bacterium]
MRMVMMATVMAIGFLGMTEGRAVAQDMPSTEYTFTDDLVEGDLMRPDGDMALVRGRRQTISLIRIRETFVPEMLKSVENL